MSYTQVVFHEVPIVGKPARFSLNGQVATSSPVAVVNTDQQHPGWYWITTSSGHSYMGQAQTQVTMYGQPTAFVGQQQYTSAGPPAYARPRRDRVTAGILALLLGGLGIHRFYLSQPGWGIAYLLFCWTCIPPIVAFVEALILFFMSDREFDARYNSLPPYY